MYCPRMGAGPQPTRLYLLAPMVAKEHNEYAMRSLVLTIKIEFPALDDLITYLELRDIQQSQIDGLVAQVEDLTKKLNQSETTLKGAEPQ